MAEMRYSDFLALLIAEEEKASTSEQWLVLLRYYDQLLQALPDQAELYHHRSIALQNLGLYDLALWDAKQAVRLSPNFPLAWCNKALLHLTLGGNEQGWQDYEWRWKTNLPAFEPLGIDIPQWQGMGQGEPIGEGKLLIHVEQGFGDNIQFVRYAIEAKRRGLNVVVLNHTGIENLLNFNLARYGVETVPNGSTIYGLKYHIPMMSLLLALRLFSEIPPLAGGYLQAEPAFAEKWASLVPASRKPKIGIVWGGSPKHKRNLSRSLDFAQLAPLFELDGEFHCLQKVLNKADCKRSDFPKNLHLWADRLDDFSDTAGLIEQMDLVISVDTSVAHLAAAMGKPTWILLSFHPDFRWGLERTDSDWYQSVRLFRQGADLSWQPVIDQLVQSLTDWSENKSIALAGVNS
ncbi:glycosyltransferase [Haemophilus paracuniculus]|uniref:Glycosyltransferase n=1 Tax=Haemophilus paracuniculus TaxID=734 RepID=A0A1T0AR75_9PAST|nr:glycosyltransferase family 9 protein [Haemophilus paracuniculus]OOR98711.1 glycosyltransferase [Haemophilus paracuniculus]